MEAAPMKRCSALGGVLTKYSEAVIITTESWLMASQLKFSVTLPWNGPQYFRMVCGMAEPFRSEARESRCPPRTMMAAVALFCPQRHYFAAHAGARREPKFAQANSVETEIRSAQVKTEPQAHGFGWTFGTAARQPGCIRTQLRRRAASLPTSKPSGQREDLNTDGVAATMMFLLATTTDRLDLTGGPAVAHPGRHASGHD